MEALTVEGGCALCLWAIPYVPHTNTDDPFLPFFVPTGDLVFPHEKGLVIRCSSPPVHSAGASVILPIGAAEYTATAGLGAVSMTQGELTGGECTPSARNGLHCRCDAVCIPDAGHEA